LQFINLLPLCKLLFRFILTIFSVAIKYSKSCR